MRLAFFHQGCCTSLLEKQPLEVLHQFLAVEPSLPGLRLTVVRPRVQEGNPS